MKSLQFEIDSKDHNTPYHESVTINFSCDISSNKQQLESAFKSLLAKHFPLSEVFTKEKWDEMIAAQDEFYESLTLIDNRKEANVR